MKRVSLVLAFMISCLCASAQEFVYDVKFDYLFHNSEFDRSNNVFEQSGTLHAARFTPLIGADWYPGRGVRHSVRLGVDVFKNMGEDMLAKDLFQEMLLYYQAEVPVREGTFSAVAGVFPRAFSEGYYSDAFFSDEMIYLDNNYEGMFLKYKAPHFYADLGLDWCGMKGPAKREAFRIMSTGTVDFFGTDLFGLGWTASVFHYAGSETIRGVVDNTLVNPYLIANLSSAVGMQALSLRAGPMVGYQWDRVYDEETHMPWGVETVFTIQNWNFGIEDVFYRGDDLYYYNDKYGSQIYYGEPFYSWPEEGKSWIDKLKVYYMPDIADCIKLRVAVELFFGKAMESCPVVYRGTNQILSLIFDLDKLTR